MSHNIQQATTDMLGDVVATAIPRHCDDPVWNWIFGSGADLESRLTPWLAMWMDALIRLGDVWCVGDALGVASLLPPDDLVDLYQTEVQTLSVLAEMAERPDRYWRIWDWATDAAPHAGYRLLELSVSPGHRGGGIGSALVTHCLETAARDRERVYTVASSPHAVEFFKRFGFDVAVSGQPSVGGPTVWILST